MSPRIKRLLPLIIIITIIGGSSVVFFLRAPVLLVTDNSFNFLYGPKRIRFKQIEASLRLFRPVRLVMVNEGAAPDLLALSARASSASPYAVFFPYRYEQGASQYMAENPGIPVLVFAGRSRVYQNEEGAKYIRTDTAADFYRAGCAAVLISRDPSADIIVLHDETISSGHKEAFSSGVKDMGDPRDPVFVDPSPDSYQADNYACITVVGTDVDFFGRNRSIPAILFTWMDPSFTPDGVKVVLDDSPFALLVEAVKKLEKGEGEIVLQSELSFIKERLEDKNLAKSLKAIAKNPQKWQN